MRILLDTHVLLWALLVPEKIRPEVARLLESDEVEVHLSVVSLWEVSLKRRLRDLGVDRHFPEEVQALGLPVLTVLEAHAWAFRDVPEFHGDPFDRMLVAQAMAERFTLLTADRTILKYPVDVIRA